MLFILNFLDDEEQSKCQDPSLYKNEGFYCFTGGRFSILYNVHGLILDQTLCNFPFNHDGTEHFSPITDDDGALKCKKGDTLEDCKLCIGIA